MEENMGILMNETGAAAASGGMGLGVIVIYIIGIIAVFYFLMIRPQKKEQKKWLHFFPHWRSGTAF